jgi:hypothetical protein
MHNSGGSAPTEEIDMAQAKVTTNHDETRKWAEARGGRPAAVRSTQSKDAAIIRIEFPDTPNAKDERPKPESTAKARPAVITANAELRPVRSLPTISYTGLLR